MQVEAPNHVFKSKVQNHKNFTKPIAFQQNSDELIHRK